MHNLPQCKSASEPGIASLLVTVISLALIGTTTSKAQNTLVTVYMAGRYPAASI
jgi:hypothetical protein